MYRNKTARQHNFAIVPSAEIPRSRFSMRQTRKMAFDASELIPIMVEEVLPGDTWQHTESIMARLPTPIAPLMDDMDLETFYFYVPNRITWSSWEEFITGTDVNALVPTINPLDATDANKIELGSVFDHMGLMPQDYAFANPINVFPIWAYFKIYNDWFRDQNLQEEWEWNDAWSTGFSTSITQGATEWDQMPLRANKRSDYFTRSLPWPQKGEAITLPLGSTAPIIPDVSNVGLNSNAPIFNFTGSAWPGPNSGSFLAGISTDDQVHWAGGNPGVSASPGRWTSSGLVADLSEATAATINAIRLAFQTQKLLERDARGGSRYVEQLLSHWKVRSPDFRLQRPEYLGGSKIPITVNPIAQTAAYDAEPADAASPVGNLGAEMHASGNKRTFTYAATEHGYIIGLAVVRSTPTYQQGTRRHWKRSTRLDFFFPVFGSLGEQAVRTQEIYEPASGVVTNATWGYQERWAEYRYTPNEITGVMRSTAAQPLDWWHLSEEFSGEPALNAAFITDKTQEVLARSLATAPSAQWSAQILLDILHDSTVARLMPTYSVPGMIDHF